MLSVSEQLNEKFPTLSCALAMEFFYVASILAFRFIATISPFCHPLSTAEPSPLYHTQHSMSKYENVFKSPCKMCGAIDHE